MLGSQRILEALLAKASNAGETEALLAKASNAWETSGNAEDPGDTSHIPGHHSNSLSTC